VFHFEKFKIVFLLGLVFGVGVHAIEPMPYDPIANIYPDSGVSQKTRDSLTLKPKRIRLNQAGYRTQDVAAGMAKFYYVGSALQFNVIDTVTKTVVGTGTLTGKGFNSGTKFSTQATIWAGGPNGDQDLAYKMSTDGLGTTIPSSPVMEGTLPTSLVEGGVYKIQVGTDTSFSFVVTDNLYGMVRDGVIKYFGIVRSGPGPSWFHAPSHMKDGTMATPSAPGAYTGGWYDCGDHLKEPVTMGFALSMLSTLAATMPDKDADHYGNNHANTLRTDGIPDILNEARFGAQFFLNSWTRNGRKTAGMITGVGNFGADHGWWGRPENQDAMTEAGRGGWKERNVWSLLGGSVPGDVATGLAILSRRWRPYDPKWADTALTAAKEIYAYGKANPAPYTGIAPYGQTVMHAHAALAMAATALLWATKDPAYLKDLAYDKTIGPQGGDAFFVNSVFDGGWFAVTNKFFSKNKSAANMTWANRHPLPLYAFYKLILANKDTALAYGVASEAERQLLIRRVVTNLVDNLSGISGSGATLTLPGPGDGNGTTKTIGWDPNWYTMQTQEEWVWNRYQIANTAELYFYYDVAKDLDAGLAGTWATSQNWQRPAIRQLMIRQMDYMLGENPWDVSMISGLGKKNFNHPHIRAANPEGRNTPGATYGYHVPVGALYGAWDPKNYGTGGQLDFWNKYHNTEVCTDGAAASLAAVVGLAADVPLNIPPKVQTKVVYVSDTSAQIEIQTDKYGSVQLDVGLTPGVWIKKLVSDSAGVSFKFLVGGLKPATQYAFDVVAADRFGNAATYTSWPNPLPDGTPYTFTTKSGPVGPAQITGVKVCNVTADSAEIMWYTPDGEHQSSICYGTSPATVTTCLDNVDVAGHPTKFHYVKIGNLKEKTSYWFKVGSDGVWDDNAGTFYKFTTPVRMANFGIYSVKYTVGGMPAMAINIVNNESRSYDSLTLRVYVRSKDTLAMTGHFWGQPPRNVPVRFADAVQSRYDICIAYNGAGFNLPCSDSTWGKHPITGGAWDWGQMGAAVQLLQPVKMPETYNPADSTYAYYFNLPLGPTAMVQGSRIRFDVIFADKQVDAKPPTVQHRQLLNWIRAFTPDQGVIPDTGWFDQGPVGPEIWHTWGKSTKDWSFMPHSTAAGDPVDFQGMLEVADQAAADALIDDISPDVALNPYMTVYRKGEFVYGFSPSYIEQATKKTYWGAEIKYDAPFNVPYGNTIVLDKPSSTVHVKGTANIYDKLTPAAKGVITDIWVNGKRLTDAEMATAAVQNPTTKLWNLDIPVKMGVGGNNIDITIFGGSGTCPDTATSCNAGCAFDNGSWFVQFTKGKSTASSIAFLDPATSTSITGELVTDSSKVVVEVLDNDNNLAKAAKDVVKVVLRSGKDSVVLTLTETGDSTGVFRSGAVAISSIPGWTVASVSPAGGDTLVARYLDANDGEDSSSVWLRVKSLWPSPLKGGIFRSCGGAYEARVKFDRAFPGSSPGAELVANGGFESPAMTSSQVISTGNFTGWTASAVDLVRSDYLSSHGGTQSIDINSTAAGSLSQTIASTPGAPLSLSFAWTTNNTVPVTDIRMSVLWNGVAVDTIRGNGSLPRVWTTYSRNLVSTGADVLTFKSLTTGSYGIMLDDISVRATGAVSALGPDTVVLRTAAGDTLRVPVAGSSTSLDALGTTLTIPLALVPENGARTGRATISIPDGRGGYKTVTQALSDSVGPWIDSAKIVENLEGRLVDTIALWMSEPVVAPAKAWFLSVSRSGTPLSTAGFVVDSAWLSDPATGRWTVVVRTGIVKAGDQLLLDPALVRDLKGNAAENCPTLVRDLKLWVRQAPVSRAWIRDANGDGTADQVVVVYKRALRAGETPDLARVRFGVLDSLRDVALVPVVGDSIVVANLPVPYDRSVTVGSALDRSGTVALFKGSDSLSVVLTDSVGPGLLSARLQYGEAATDTLLLAFTEPISSVAGTAWMQILKVAGTNLKVVGTPVLAPSGLWKIAVDTGSVVPGDSVRPLAGGRFVDANGRSAATLHPWIEVQGDDRPPAKAWYSDVDGDGAVDQVSMVWARAPRTRPSFVLLWPSSTGGYDTVRVASTAWILQADGRTAVLPIGPFDRGITSSPTTDLGRQVANGTTSSFPIQDSVPPVLLSVRLSYDAVGQSADTLTATFSEPVAMDLQTTGIEAKSAPGSNLAFKGQAFSANGLVWTIPVTSESVFPGDSVRPSAVLGVSDAATNRPSVLHRWVEVAGAERAPQVAWYQDRDGDGAVDHVVVRWTHGPRTKPNLSFLWPNGRGGMDSVSSGTAWSLEPDGTTLSLAIGPFAVGVTSSPTTNLGRQTSAGTITAFPILDSVPAVMTSARLGYAQADGLPDTLHLAWSEPVLWNGGEPLAMVRTGLVVSPVRGTLTILRPDNMGAIVLLDPLDSSLTVFRSGDHVRLAPASAGTVSDRFGNVVEDPTRWVPVILGRRPPRFQVTFDPNKLLYKGWPIEPGPALQIYVKSATDTRWIDFATGQVVPTEKVEKQGMGPVISLNQPLRGKAIVYDNQGTFVGNVDLDLLGAAFYNGTLPMDASNQYQVRIQWYGLAANGKPAASGVYFMRLVLWQNTAAENEEPEWRVVNQVYPFGWEVSTK